MNRVGAEERERELVREMFPQVVLHAATISADQEKRGVTIKKPVRRSGKVRSFVFTLLARALSVKKNIVLALSDRLRKSDL